MKGNQNQINSKSLNIKELQFLELSRKEGCSGCVKVENSNIKDHPEVMAFAEEIPYGHLILCNMTLKEADPYTEYTLPNGDSKFQFDATFDLQCGFHSYDVTCKNLEILQSKNEKLKMKALNEINVDCSEPGLKPEEFGKAFYAMYVDKKNHIIDYFFSRFPYSYRRFQ